MRSIRQFESAQVVPVALGPVGLAVVVVAKTPEQGVLGGGDAAVWARLGIAEVFEKGDDNTRRGWAN